MASNDLGGRGAPQGGSVASAPDRAYRWLKEQIVSLPWERDAFLTEKQVADASGLSRTPVREAILRLEAEGFVRRVPHKGAYVPAITDADVDHLMQARRVIEEWSVGQMIGSGHDAISQLATVVHRQEEIISDPIDFIAADLEFHLTIVGSSRNPLLLDFYNSLRDRQVRMGIMAIVQDTSRADQVLHEHRAIVAALEAGDIDRSTAAIHAHLDTTRRAMKASRGS